MAYFDNAATTFPKPECVYDFMNTFYRECGGNAGRGSHKLSIGAGKMVSETRNRLKKLLHCENKQIVFTPSATIALNMILQGVLDGKMTAGANVYISPSTFCLDNISYICLTKPLVVLLHPLL